MFDVIIIGAGPVGLYATFMCGYMKIKALCLEIDDYIGGQPAKIYPNKYIHDFPGFKKISGKELINKLHEQCLNYSEYVKIQTKTKIISYQYIPNQEYYELIDENQKKYYAKFILITSGNGSLHINKIDDKVIKHHEHIHYVLKEIDYYFNKKIAILGGGDGAIDYCLQLKELFPNNEIHLIHHRDQLSSLTKSSDDLLKNNIKLYLGHHILECHKDHIILKYDNDIKKIPVDTILVQYGIKIDLNDNIFNNLETTNQKFNVLSNHYQTSDPNIYVAGSCVYMPNRINMIITGISEATIALNHIKSRLPKTEKVVW